MASLRPKILARAVVSVALIWLCPVSANALVIFTDIEDVGFGSENGLLNIDFNNDGTDDLRVLSELNMFEARGIGDTGVLATPARPPNAGATASAVERGSLIGAVVGVGREYFQTQQVTPRREVGAILNTCFTAGCAGQFVDFEEAFLGVRFEIKDELHFGWVRVESQIPPGFDLNITGGKVTGFAYETVSGVGIAAGAVPEPSSTTLLVIGFICLARRSRARWTDEIVTK